MAIKESAIRLVLKAKDLLSKDVKKSSAALDAFKEEAKKLKDQLKGLENQQNLLASFKKQAKATQDAGRTFRGAEEKVAKLAKEIGKTGKPTKAMQAALAKARREVKKANTEYGRQREALAKLRGSMASAGLSTRNLKDQQAKLERQIKETRKAFNRADESAKRTARTLSNSNLKKTARDADVASTSIGRLTRRFIGLAAAGAGLYAIKRAIEGVLTTGDQFERLGVQMEAITGSSGEAEKAMQWIKDFTRNTPFQLEEVSEAFVRLKAFGLDPTDGSMQAIIDQASKLGGGMERLNGITLGLGKAWAKQKLQGEEILMLLERGVPVWDLLEKVTGKNVQELQKLSSAGKLGRDAIKGLIQEIGKTSEGAAAKNMSLLSGYVSNLKDSWQQFQDEVAKSGALEYAKETLAGIAAQIERMSKNGQLSELAKKVSESFIAMGEAIKYAFSGVTIDSFVAKIQTGFSAIIESMAALRTAFDFTNSTVKFFFNTFTGVVKGFATAYTGMMYGIIRVWQETADALGFDGIAEKLKGTTDFLGGLTKEFARQTVKDAKEATDALSGVYDSFADVSEAAVKKATDTVKIMTRSNKLLWQHYADELVEGQKKVEEASAETAGAVKANFKDAADAISQVNTTKTRTELASLGVALAEAFSQGTLSAEEYYKATEASREKLADLKAEAKDTRDAIKDTGDTAEKAGEQQTQALENATSIAGVMAGHYNGITTELQGMSSAAHDTFIAMQKGVGGISTSEAKGGIEELKNELKESNQELSDLHHSVLTTFDPTGISRWMNETATDAAHVKAKFLEQKIALEELFESYEQGNLTSRSFVRQSEKAAESMDLLNEQDLDKLNNALVSAQQNMTNLGESSRNTLESLQNELDQLKGKQDEVERRNYETRKRELKAELEEAKEKGDSAAVQNLNKSLRVSEQIYNEKRRQAQQEKTKELQQSQAKHSVTSPISTKQQTPQKIIRLEYPGGGVNVGIDSRDETKLLEALKNAGMRTV